VKMNATRADVMMLGWLLDRARPMLQPTRSTNVRYRVERLARLGLVELTSTRRHPNAYRVTPKGRHLYDQFVRAIMSA
jgi:predicted MarR family transcription regulator